MICPICDSAIRENEFLYIGPTKSDGFFIVKHKAMLWPATKTLHDSWYNSLTIDTTPPKLRSRYDN